MSYWEHTTIEDLAIGGIDPVQLRWACGEDSFLPQFRYDRVERPYFHRLTDSARCNEAVSDAQIDPNGNAWPIQG